MCVRARVPMCMSACSSSLTLSELCDPPPPPSALTLPVGKAPTRTEAADPGGWRHLPPAAGLEGTTVRG